MRTNFYDFFRVNSDFSLTVKKDITISSVTWHKNVTIHKDIAFSGICLSEHIGHDLEIKKTKKGNILTGIY